jgi:polar amino acid transport system substrate-binding protein
MGRARTAFRAASLAAAVALTAAACSTGVVEVGARPSSGALPQVGGVDSTKPSAAATAAGQTCDPAALSLRPTAADADGPTVTAIRNRGRLIVGVSQDHYLTGYLNAAGDETGFDVDIARQVEQAIFGTEDDAHIQFVAVTNQQRIDYLQGAQPKLDIVVDVFTITCERAQRVLFSTVYYDGTQKVLVPKGSGYRSLDDLGGKKVCAQAGSTSLERIKAYPSHPQAYGTANLTDCLVALQQGQVAAISTDDTNLAGLAQQDPNTEVVGPALEPEPYGVAAARVSPDLIRFVNGVLERIRPQVWGQIYDHWLAPALGAARPPAAQYAD